MLRIFSNLCQSRCQINETLFYRIVPSIKTESLSFGCSDLDKISAAPFQDWRSLERETRFLLRISSNWSEEYYHKHNSE